MEGQPAEDQPLGYQRRQELMELLESAVSAGNLEPLVRLFKMLKLNYASYDEYVLETFQIAARAGHLHVLEWLDQKVRGVLEIDSIFNCVTCVAAIAITASQTGRAELLDWLVSYGREKYGLSEDLIKQWIMHRGFTSRALEEQSEAFGELACLESLNTFVEAALQGRIAVLMWFKVNCPSILTSEYLDQAASEAAASCQVETLEWLVAHGANINIREYSAPIHEAAAGLDDASKHYLKSFDSVIDVFKWLLEHGTAIDHTCQNSASGPWQAIDTAFAYAVSPSPFFRDRHIHSLPFDSIFWLILHGASSEGFFNSTLQLRSTPGQFYADRYAGKPLLYALLLGDNETAKSELEIFQGQDNELKEAILLMIALQREDVLDRAFGKYSLFMADIWEDMLEVAACTRNLKLFKKIYAFILGQTRKQIEAGKEDAEERFSRALEVGLRWSAISRAEPLFYFLLERAVAYGRVPDIRLSAVGSMVARILRYHDRLARENRGELLQSHEYAMFTRMRDCLRRATYLQLSAGVYHTRPGFDDANNRLTNLMTQIAQGVSEEIERREMPREIAELIMSFILGPSNAEPETNVREREAIHSFNPGTLLETASSAVENVIISHPRIAFVAMMLIMYAMNGWTSSSNM